MWRVDELFNKRENNMSDVSIQTGNAITIPADQVSDSCYACNGAGCPVCSGKGIGVNPVVHDSEQKGGDYDLTVIARYPYQMEKCQTALIEWAKRKIATVAAEAADLEENVGIAKVRKWGSAALERAWKRSLKTVDFYTKILAALEAGHCIVPNFPVDIIAVRTKRKRPVKETTTDWSRTHTQSSESPSIGEGEFEAAVPVIRQRVIERNPDGSEKTKEYFAHEWAEFDFPFTTAKPEILDATGRAMQDKFFDEIGVLPGKKKREDPIIVGRIYDPRSSAATPWDRRSRGHAQSARERFVTFLIAWYVDTRAI